MWKNKQTNKNDFLFLLAQGPLMITGPGMGGFQQPTFGGAAYPQYGGAPGYSGF
jgi:hypothetical protein